MLLLYIPKLHHSFLFVYYFVSYSMQLSISFVYVHLLYFVLIVLSLSFRVCPLFRPSILAQHLTVSNDIVTPRQLTTHKFRNEMHIRYYHYILNMPIPVSARSKAWNCGRSFLGVWVRISPGAQISVSMSVVCRQVEVPATGGSLAQRSPTEFWVSKCNRVASTMTPGAAALLVRRNNF